MVTINEAVKLKRLTNTVVDLFDEGDWQMLEVVLDGGQLISQHDRLFRSMHFGDDDYTYCVAEVLQALVTHAPGDFQKIMDYLAGAYGNKTISMIEDAENPMLSRRGPCSLFISHKAEEKLVATNLKKELIPYGIASFVAHEDIGVTVEWEREIERRLSTCDAFVYLASSASNSSEWCQQEIGWAFGRGIPMMSVALNANPVGFLGARQALRAGAQCGCSIISQVVFDTLIADPRVSHLIVDGLIDNLTTSVRFDDSNKYATRLASAPTITGEQAERIEEAIARNDQVMYANHGTLPEYLRTMIAEKTGDVPQVNKAQSHR